MLKIASNLTPDLQRSCATNVRSMAKICENERKPREVRCYCYQKMGHIKIVCPEKPIPECNKGSETSCTKLNE